jgi:hypothetical protein
VLGNEHPNVLFSMRVQLDILRDLGMMEQLRDLLRVAWPAHEVLGVDHPDTVRLRRQYEAEWSLL